MPRDAADKAAGCGRRGDTAADGATPRLCDFELECQNAAFAGTGGISPNNRQAGFLPAYQNTVTGEIVISRFADGSPAPVHVLEGLPADWVALRDAAGAVVRVLDAIVAGFLRDGAFYTREAAAQLVAVESATKK
jgi:hypothetical protein